MNKEREAHLVNEKEKGNQLVDKPVLVLHIIESECFLPLIT